MRKLIALTLFFTLCISAATAQSDSDLLFSVADRDVTVGEFKYIYEKTNGEAATYGRESLDEYLELYQRFKLKVSRAYDMGLDTVKALQNELAGYRRQLADNYLIDRAVTDKLVEELYERKKEDVDISHILFVLKSSSTPADTLAAYQKALEVKAGLNRKNFAEMAQTHSEDRFSNSRGGQIGFLSAPMPNGLYPLESAVYAAEIGEVVGPIRTSFGYHLAMVNDRRPARGEVEVAHILVRKPEKEDPAPAREQIEQVKALLDAGQPFQKLAATMSDDEKTSRNGGYIGFFGINRYEKSFENAAFALAADGATSDIVETKTGFHIIKRISRRGIQPFADERPLLVSKVKEDSRFETATNRLLKRIRQRAGLQFDNTAFGRFTASLADTSFLTFRWKAPDPDSQEPLLTIGEDYVLTMGHFQRYLESAARQRSAQLSRGNSATVAKTLYDEYLADQLIAYEESKLEENYPDFRSLMREYEEGILLFEATKMEVWDKASQDSVGLARYFEENSEDYIWDKRARITRYTVGPELVDQIFKIREAAENGTAEEVVAQFQPEGGSAAIQTREDVYERDRLKQFDELEYRPGSLSKVENSPRNGQLIFYKVEELIPGGPKKLEEARGYVIADYQDQLEKEWVAQLRKQYPVKLRKRTFEKMVKD